MMRNDGTLLHIKTLARRCLRVPYLAKFISEWPIHCTRCVIQCAGLTVYPWLPWFLASFKRTNVAQKRMTAFGRSDPDMGHQRYICGWHLMAKIVWWALLNARHPLPLINACFCHRILPILHHVLTIKGSLLTWVLIISARFGYRMLLCTYVICICHFLCTLALFTGQIILLVK